MTRTISIERRKPLAEQPRTGHNRWHPDIPPIVEVDEGEEVLARDPRRRRRLPQPALDRGRLAAVRRRDPPADRAGAREGRQPRRPARGRVRRHQPEPWGVQRHLPGPRLPPRRHDDAVLGPLDRRRRLGDLAADPRRADPRSAVHGRLGRGTLAGPGRGVDAPRGRRWRRAAGSPCRPTPGGPCPRRRRPRRGLRTMPPRENGGNVDVKQLTRGLAAALAGRRREPCSRPATATSPRATANAA